MHYEINPEIKQKLDFFKSRSQIPNILFYGAPGSGKSTIMNYFIHSIYPTNEDIRKFVMYINCAQCKGIKFIRDDLKFFAKSNIHNTHIGNFKSVVLFNADKLTIDAQSALRRCIEIFCTTTRFFVVVENKEGLLKPILSRFCEIFVPFPKINKNKINLYRYDIDKSYKETDNKRTLKFKVEFEKLMQTSEPIDIFMISDTLYNKGYSGLDFIQFIDNLKWNTQIPIRRRCELQLHFEKSIKEIRNEKLLLSSMMHLTFIDDQSKVMESTII